MNFRRIVDHWLDAFVFLLIVVSTISGVNYFDSELVFDAKILEINNYESPFSILLEINPMINETLDYEIEVMYKRENLVVGSDILSCANSCESEIILDKIFFDAHDVIVRTNYLNKTYEKKFTFVFEREGADHSVFIDDEVLWEGGSDLKIGGWLESETKGVEKKYVFDFFPSRRPDLKTSFPFNCTSFCEFNFSLKSDIVFEEYTVNVYSQIDVAKTTFNVVANLTGDEGKGTPKPKLEQEEKEKPILTEYFRNEIERTQKDKLSDNFFIDENTNWTGNWNVIDEKISTLKNKFENNGFGRVEKIIEKENGKYDLDIDLGGTQIKFSNSEIEKINDFMVYSDKQFKSDIFFADVEEGSFDSSQIILRKDSGFVSSIKVCSDFTNVVNSTFDESKINFSDDLCLSGWVDSGYDFEQNDTHVWFNSTHFSAYVAEFFIFNPQSYSVVDGKWSVEFNSARIADLWISASGETTWSLDSSDDVGLQFMYIMCGDNIFEYEWIDSSLYIEDYFCSEKSYVVSEVLSEKSHTLEFIYGSEFAYVENLIFDENITLNISEISSLGIVLDETSIDFGSNLVDSQNLSNVITMISMEAQNNVSVKCTSGNCLRFKEDFIDGIDMRKNDKTLINFNCLSDRVGNFAANFSIYSNENLPYENISLSCRIIKSYGELNISIKKPSPDFTINLDETESFDLEVKVSCVGESGVDCGNVDVTPRHSYAIMNYPHRVQIQIDEFSGIKRTGVPITTTIRGLDSNTYKIDSCVDDTRIFSNQSGTLKEIPSQFLAGDDKSWCQFVFFGDVSENANAEVNYFLYYGYDAGSPSYPSSIRSNDDLSGWDIDNGLIQWSYSWAGGAGNGPWRHMITSPGGQEINSLAKSGDDSFKQRDLFTSFTTLVDGPLYKEFELVSTIRGTQIMKVYANQNWFEIENDYVCENNCKDYYLIGAGGNGDDTKWYSGSSSGTSNTEELDSNYYMVGLNPSGWTLGVIGDRSQFKKLNFFSNIGSWFSGGESYGGGYPYWVFTTDDELVAESTYVKIKNPIDDSKITLVHEDNFDYRPFSTIIGTTPMYSTDNQFKTCDSLNENGSDCTLTWKIFPTDVGEYDFEIFASSSLENIFNVTSSKQKIQIVQPQVSLDFPSEGFITNNFTNYYSVNIYDWTMLEKATLNIWNSTGDLVGINSTKLSKLSEFVNLSFTVPSEGTYYWNYEAFDVAGAKSFSSENFSIFVDPKSNIDTVLYNSDGGLVDADVELIKGKKVIEKYKLSDKKRSSEIGDIEFNFKSGKVKKIKVFNSKLEDIKIGFEEVPKEKIKMVNSVSHAFAIDPTELPDGQKFEVTFVATGMAVMKCVDYNFSTQTCFGDYKKILDTVPGKEYTLLLDNVDPVFVQVDDVLLSPTSAACEELGGGYAAGNCDDTSYTGYTVCDGSAEYTFCDDGLIEDQQTDQNGGGGGGIEVGFGDISHGICEVINKVEVLHEVWVQNSKLTATIQVDADGDGYVNTGYTSSSTTANPGVTATDVTAALTGGETWDCADFFSASSTAKIRNIVTTTSKTNYLASTDVLYYRVSYNYTQLDSLLTDQTSYYQGESVLISGDAIWGNSENISVKITRNDSTIDQYYTMTNASGQWNLTYDLGAYYVDNTYTIYASQVSNTSLNATVNFNVIQRTPTAIPDKSYATLNQTVTFTGSDWKTSDTLNVSYTGIDGSINASFDTINANSTGGFSYDWNTTKSYMMETGTHVFNFTEPGNTSYGDSRIIVTTFWPNSASTNLADVNESDINVYNVDTGGGSQTFDVGFPQLLPSSGVILDSLKVYVEYSTTGTSTKDLQWYNDTSTSYQTICANLPDQPVETAYECDLTSQANYLDDYNSLNLRFTENGNGDNFDINFIYILRNFSILPPTVNLEAPTNNTYRNSGSGFTFDYNVTHPSNGITSCRLYINGILNQTNNSITKDTTQTFNLLAPLGQGAHTWYVSCTEDSEAAVVGDSGTFNLNIDLTKPVVSLSSPADLASDNASVQYFVASLTDGFKLKNATLYVWNSTGVFTNSTTITGTSDTANVSYAWSDYLTWHTWNYLVYDEAGNSDWAFDNRTFFYGVLRDIETDSGNYIQSATVYGTGKDVWTPGQTVYVNITRSDSTVDALPGQVVNATNGFNFTYPIGDYYSTGTYTIFAIQDNDPSLNATKTFDVNLRTPTVSSDVNFIGFNETITFTGTNNWVRSGNVNISKILPSGVSELNFDNDTTTATGTFSYPWTFNSYIEETGNLTFNFTESTNSSYSANDWFLSGFRPSWSSGTLANFNTSNDVDLLVGGGGGIQTVDFNFSQIAPSDASIDKLTLYVEYSTTSTANRELRWYNISDASYTTMCVFADQAVDTTVSCEINSSYTNYNSNYNDLRFQFWEDGSGGALWDVDFVYLTRNFTLNPPTVNLENPIDNFVQNTNTNINFTYNVSSYYDINNCKLYIDDLENATDNSITKGVTQNFMFTDTLSDGLHTWLVSCTEDSISLNVGNSSTRNLRIDTSGPVVNLVSPSDNSASNILTNNFTGSFTDSYNLENATLQIWNSTGDLIGTNSTNVNGTSNSSNLQFTFPSDGVYTWNYLVYDQAGNSGTNSTNYTFTIDTTSPIVDLTNPFNDTIGGLSWTFTGNFSDSLSGLKNATLQIWNSTGSLIGTNSSTITGNVNGSSLDFTFTQGGIYNWNYLVYDQAENSGINSTNYTITVDTIPPVVNLTSPLNGTTGYLSWTFIGNFSDADYGLKNATLQIWNSSGSLIGINSTSITGNVNGSSLDFTLSDEGTYYWNYLVYDGVDNFATNATNYTIFVDTTAPSVVLGSPLNNSYNGTSLQTFIANSTDAGAGLKNATLQVWNSTGALIGTNFTNITGSTNSTPLSFLLPYDGSFEWNFIVYDDIGLSNTSNVNFTINLDTQGPNVTLISPGNGSANSEFENSFEANFTDGYALLNTTLYIWNSTGDLIGTNSTTITGTSDSKTLNFTFPYQGTFEWNYLTYDSLGNSDFASLNNTLTIDTSVIGVNLLSPSDNYVSNILYQEFNANFSDVIGLKNVTLYIWNSTGGIVSTNSTTITGLTNETNLSYTFPSVSETYEWNYLAYGTLGNSGFAITNYTFKIDVSNPLINFTGNTSNDGAYVNQTFAEVDVTINDASTTSAYVDFNDDLLMYLNFENVSGGIIYDKSSYSNNGYIQNSVSVDNSSNIRGNYGNFTGGVNDYVNASTADLSGLDTFTFSAWINPTTNGTNRSIFTATTKDGNDRFGLRYKTDGSGPGINVIQASIKTDVGNITVESSNNSQTLGWTHVAMTWSSDGAIKLYINGVLDNLTYSSGTLGGTTLPDTELFIGDGANDENWDGLIDEIFIFNRDLPLNEIKPLYDSKVNSISSNYSELKNDPYNYYACAIDSFGYQNCTETRTININYTLPLFTINSPVDGSKFFENELIYFNTTTDGSIITFVMEINDNSTIYNMYNTTINDYKYNLSNLSVGTYEVAFYGNDSLGNTINLNSTFYILPTKNITVEKDVQFLGSDKYQITLNVTNNGIWDNYTLYDLVYSNSTAADFSPAYTDTNPLYGSMYSGDIIRWNFTLAYNTSTTFRYNITGTLPRYFSSRNFILSVE